MERNQEDRVWDTNQEEVLMENKISHAEEEEVVEVESAASVVGEVDKEDNSEDEIQTKADMCKLCSKDDLKGILLEALQEIGVSSSPPRQTKNKGKQSTRINSPEGQLNLFLDLSTQTFLSRVHPWRLC